MRQLLPHVVFSVTVGVASGTAFWLAQYGLCITGHALAALGRAARPGRNR